MLPAPPKMIIELLKKISLSLTCNWYLHGFWISTTLYYKQLYIAVVSIFSVPVLCSFIYNGEMRGRDKFKLMWIWLVSRDEINIKQEHIKRPLH